MSAFSFTLLSIKYLFLHSDLMFLAHIFSAHLPPSPCKLSMKTLSLCESEICTETCSLQIFLLLSQIRLSFSPSLAIIQVNRIIKWNCKENVLQNSLPLLKPLSAFSQIGAVSLPSSQSPANAMTV